MPKKGYKQTPGHIEKAVQSRMRLVGINNPAYKQISKTTKLQIIDLINRGLSVSQLSKALALSKYIIKRSAKEESSDIFNKLLVNNQRFISLSKIGNLNPMKKLENILKRKQKVDYKLIARKMSETRKELFKKGRLRHWKEIHPLRWSDLLIKSQRRMRKNNPMFNSDIVRKIKESGKMKGIYEASSERLKLLWRQSDFREKNIKRLKSNNPMKREEVIIKNWKSHQHNPTCIEKEFIKLINDYNLPIRYVGDARFFIGHKNPDFKVTGQNKVIEITSDAYNRTKDNYSKPVVNYYRNTGYDCLVIWSSCRRYEDELKNENLMRTLNKIKNFINDNKKAKPSL